MDLSAVNPQSGPFWVEGAEPGDTLALHFVSMEPARDFGVSAAIPFFGGLTSTERTAMLQDPLPDLTWVYELDRAAGTVGFVASTATSGWSCRSTSCWAPWAWPRPAGRCAARWCPTRSAATWTPRDAAGGHLLPAGQREGRAVQPGDGHYRQGEGEACGTAVEGAMTTTVIVELIKGAASAGGPAWPRVEDDTHWMTVGSSRPLEDAWRIGQTQLVHWFVGIFGWT